MFRGGMILRLIDVCFNILIGFILITDRSFKVQLDLPTSGGEAETAQTLPLLEVHIEADRQVIDVIRDLRDGSGDKDIYTVPLSVYRLVWEMDGNTFEVPGIPERDLAAELGTVHSKYAVVKEIAAFPDDKSRLDGYIHVYDVCKNLQLPVPAIDLGMSEAP
ncbi:hypothetical protein KKH27_09495 [bacterium]|nr:hypothetical protein [bacterium]MBU1983862.1 hypothetical protein [bacterium]